MEDPYEFVFRWRPIRDAALSAGSGEPAWAEIPSWFVLAGADRNIPVEAQRWMADRAGARETWRSARPHPPSVCPTRARWRT
ncbi:hypothetical protein [Micromonospora tarensis]|uniref:Alpha/beta hydrolase family protein n=1 Tax=Micromonospora tarensis TaxID=2806100 RepID=A0ABS1YDH1_9ACTN|nr:hypothetical protein [Micromonospora tarensis]MBM0275430.1 hypothetical protein [Micromonospora tarensis]